MTATCPVRNEFAEALLAEASSEEIAIEEIAIEVNFGSWEHPDWHPARYVRRAEDLRFHIVRRVGVPVRVHDHQFRPEFRAWLECNPFPYGRNS